MPASDKTKPHLIYRILCADGRSYVGATTQSLTRRWLSGHKTLLRCRKHQNRFMQAAWDTHGENGFTVALIETIPGRLAARRERHWIEHFDAWHPNGFNLSDPTNLATNTQKEWIVVSPRGVESTIVSLNGFCRRRGLCAVDMVLVAQGKHDHHKRWTCLPSHMSYADWRALIVVRKRASKTHHGTYLVTTPRGSKIHVDRITPWAKRRGLDQAALIRVAKGKASHHHGYTVAYLEAV